MRSPFKIRRIAPARSTGGAHAGREHPDAPRLQVFICSNGFIVYDKSQSFRLVRGIFPGFQPPGRDKKRLSEGLKIIDRIANG
jgi:hypothetical protein